MLGLVGLMAISVILMGVWFQAEPTRHAPPPMTATLILATVVPSATLTATPSPTLTPSSTATASATPTLATRVGVVTLIMPDVTLPASATPLPENLRILAEAPAPIEPLPDATLLPFPYADFTDWVSFESDHPAMHYRAGVWSPLRSERASQGQYHYTEDTHAEVGLTFTGEAVRVRYVGFTNGGVWELLVDGAVLDTIDSYAPSGAFTGTQVYTLGAGDHTLTLRNTEQANPASRGHMLALDAVQVYQPDALTVLVPDGLLPTDTPTPTLIPARRIELVQAPPSPQPTATEIPFQRVGASLLIGYDENANGVLDVSEGVRGISARLVEVGTNRVLAQGFTDERGFAELAATVNAPVLLVVPYFGQSWSVRAGSQQTFTLLLSPSNQPGLIP